jgi:hypothetical protein
MFKLPIYAIIRTKMITIKYTGNIHLMTKTMQYLQKLGITHISLHCKFDVLNTKNVCYSTLLLLHIFSCF